MVSFADRGGWWVVAQIILFGLYALAMLGTDPITEGVGLDYARVTGIVMVVIAVVIGVWSVVVLGRNLTIYPHPVHQATLADRGPYRLVRHPIYLAVIVGGVGAWHLLRGQRENRRRRRCARIPEYSRCARRTRLHPLLRGEDGLRGGWTGRARPRLPRVPVRHSLSNHPLVHVSLRCRDDVGNGSDGVGVTQRPNKEMTDAESSLERDRPR